MMIGGDGGRNGGGSGSGRGAGDTRGGGGGGGGNGRGRGRGFGRGRGAQAAVRPVSEADMISLADRLEQFRANNEVTEMTFESDLSNHDRAIVHDFCKRMGFKSKSYGKGDDRRVKVTKQKLQSGQGQNDASESPLSFSAEAQQAVMELFSSFPPTEDESIGQERVNQASTSAIQKNRPANSRRRPSMGPAEIADRLASLNSRLQSMPALQQIAEQRAKLPIAARREEITSAVENNQVVLIAGETGCGKTTQVPQYILDQMWQQGKPCRIYCTQPRQISATSVAERIATERGETLGDTIGYQVRLDSKGGKHSSLMLCTNGVLLRKLVGSSRTEEGDSTNGRNELDATHVIVDEIHERDRNAEFLLIVFRDLLPRRPDLRLILMSATLDAELFSTYFNNCPILRVPGFTYPVRKYYLEDTLGLIQNEHISTDPEPLVLSKQDADAMDEAISIAWLEDDFELLSQLVTETQGPCLCDYQHPLTGATALMVAAGRGRVEESSLFLSLGADQSRRSLDGATALDWAKRCGHEDVAARLVDADAGKESTSAAEAEMLEKYHKTVNLEEIDIRLIQKLLKAICESSSGNGAGGGQNDAVLVFLPGWEDITRARDALRASPVFGDTSRFLLLPLHSMVPASEQSKVFQRPPRGMRKIVLSTNIAETAITIDDVVYVIDSGRTKEKSYDPYSNVSTLQTTWISKASAKQREGRAGRCQPGVCYHLFSKLRAAALPDFQVPEIKRTPLEELCLQVKLLEPHGKIAEFLRKAISPPVELSVRNAILLLQDIGALTMDERLTDVGQQLGFLPVHPSTSKMLLLAILLNCLGPALTIACSTSFRDPFVLPMAPDEKRRAQLAKQQLVDAYGGYSDHLTVIAAFNGWERARASGQEARFCSQYFLSGGTMKTLAGMRLQLQNELAQKGFIPHGSNPCSLNENDLGIVRAVLLAGMYPMIGMLLPPAPDGRKAVVQTPRGEKVRIHPHSSTVKLVNAMPKGPRSQANDLLVVFDEITRGEAQVYIRNCTVVKPHGLTLIGTEMVVVPAEPVVDFEDEEAEWYDENDEEDFVKPRPQGSSAAEEQLACLSAADQNVTVVIDRWLKFTTTAVEAAQFYCLRERLAAALDFKVKHPRKQLPPLLAATVYTVACTLSYDNALDLAPPSKQPTPVPTPISNTFRDNHTNNHWVREAQPVNASQDDKTARPTPAPVSGGSSRAWQDKGAATAQQSGNGGTDRQGTHFSTQPRDGTFKWQQKGVDAGLPRDAGGRGGGSSDGMVKSSGSTRDARSGAGVYVKKAKGSSGSG